MTNAEEYDWLLPIWVRGEFIEDILTEVNASLRAANRRPWTISTLYSVVSRLRKAGVRVPRRPYRERLSERTPGVARMNEILDQLAAGQDPKVPPPPPAPPRPAPAIDPRQAIHKILDEMRAERRGG